MNPDLANLLAALREQPDDEVAYLALADWCLEQPRPETQARGEHVRLSLRAGKRAGNDAEACELRDRVKELEKRHRVAWLGSLRAFAHRCDFLPGGLVKVEVSEGRLAQVRTQTPQVTPPTPEEFAWVATMEARTLSPDGLAWLAELLPDGFVRAFSARPNLESGPEVLDALARCRWVPGLRSLGLYGYQLEGETRRLADLPGLDRLGDLSLWHNDIRLDGLAALARSPNLAGLRRLSISHNPLGPAPDASLPATVWSDSLRALELDGCGLGAEELGAICDASFTADLEELSLQHNGLSAEAVRVLAAWPGMANVRKLSLGHNGITDAGLKHLAESDHLGELRELKLESNRIGSAGLASLAGGNGLPRLKSLDIYDNDRVAEAGLLALCRSESLASLRRVRHNRFGLGAEAQKALRERFPT